MNFLICDEFAIVSVGMKHLINNVLLKSSFLSSGIKNQRNSFSKMTVFLI